MELVTPGIGLIFWQTITFLIVLGLLAAFVWRPITDALRAREGFIADSLDAAENAKKDIAKLKEDNEYLLKEARIERDKILAQANEAAKQIKEAAKEETAKITAKMTADAKAVIVSEKNAALTEVKDLVATLSLDIAEKVLRKSLEDKKAQESLVKELIKDIKVS
ncbi:MULTISPECIES: F0F1 ATP synthase subunit B [Reichenbachiella]|uniref:ATP synthase subunit b n=1 Tax=Reichenbachiella agariperforans TaxID=156994 RepID=A0A1M6WR63_REIAG|nr:MULTISPECIES: F0F1 ATP synthase subunit B [Reichenbachiella]MBU2914785.1 F0F1 ATP synthase subunit B [Reichenbachiella agariperforans]RJE71187.1 ATP synthase F0 subunit B [Reichenbachiella sp. MSK19-1]SHK96208.1 ATP synthase F0 subcomplex B subunit [Reichenbachiella agariperforans]